jgi:hypothetical protein
MFLPRGKEPKQAQHILGSHVFPRALLIKKHSEDKEQRQLLCGMSA